MQWLQISIGMSPYSFLSLLHQLKSHSVHRFAMAPQLEVSSNALTSIPIAIPMAYPVLRLPLQTARKPPKNLIPFAALALAIFQPQTIAPNTLCAMEWGHLRTRISAQPRWFTTRTWGVAKPRDCHAIAAFSSVIFAPEIPSLCTPCTRSTLGCATPTIRLCRRQLQCSSVPLITFWTRVPMPVTSSARELAITWDQREINSFFAIKQGLGWST